MKEEKLLRISRLIGKEAVQSLDQKFVVIVGVGAVGGYALEALARSGIGSFRLVDFDRVEITNINRQILALDSTIGRLKVDVAKERVLDIDNGIKVETMPIFANDDTFEAIFAGNPDLVVDAIDSLGPKCRLLETAWKKGIPVVSSMGAALRRNPSLVRTGDLTETWGCPLAKHVRANLKKRGVGKGIMTVFSPELVDFKYEEENGQKHVLGSLPTVTGVFGLTLAHLALNHLLGNELNAIASSGQKE